MSGAEAVIGLVLAIIQTYPVVAAAWKKCTTPKSEEEGLYQKFKISEHTFIMLMGWVFPEVNLSDVDRKKLETKMKEKLSQKSHEQFIAYVADYARYIRERLDKLRELFDEVSRCPRIDNEDETHY
jgi:hypothetical protein